MLILNGISKSFDTENTELKVLDNINLNVESGEFVTLIGPSGCGKSTLLRIIAGLERQDSGEVIWKDNPKISFVFQNFALFPYLTVSENIAFGLKMQGENPRLIKRIVEDLISEVGLNGFENKHPKELSGGMKQRVGIARALAMDPNVLLLDEPFSALDEFTAENLRKLFLRVWRDRLLTVIMVTHLVPEALELSDKIVVLTSRPGAVKQLIENKLKRPRNLRSKDFFALEDKVKASIEITRI